jgi:hypothetical protein
MPVFFALLPCKITLSILTYLFSYSSLVLTLTVTNKKTTLKKGGLDFYALDILSISE